MGLALTYTDGARWCAAPNIHPTHCEQETQPQVECCDQPPGGTDSSHDDVVVVVSLICILAPIRSSTPASEYYSMVVTYCTTLFVPVKHLQAMFKHILHLANCALVYLHLLAPGACIALVSASRCQIGYASQMYCWQCNPSSVHIFAVLLVHHNVVSIQFICKIKNNVVTLH